MGAGISQEFAGNQLLFNEMYLITGTYNLSRFPNVPCAMARLRTWSGNGGSIFLGTWMNTGTVNYLPFEMSAASDTGWISLSNLNELYQGHSSGSSYIAAWVQK